jgi:hypothetical protein
VFGRRMSSRRSRTWRRNVVFGRRMSSRRSRDRRSRTWRRKRRQFRVFLFHKH